MSTDPSPSAGAPSEPSGKPGRYNRSSSGLVASLVVTVLVIAGLYVFTDTFRTDNPAYEPESIDYLVSVQAAQDAGVGTVYPASVPQGWTATGVDVEPSDTTTFGLRFLTEDDEFVGIRVEEDSTTGLVQEWVDEDAVEIDDYVPAGDNEVSPQWLGFEDAGGDTGYVADLDDRTVLVYGSASPEQLQGVIDDLTTEPVES